MKRRGICFALTLTLLLLTAVVTAVQNCGWYLVLRNADTGKVYGRYAMAEGDWFSVTFVHSVNKSPVMDCYEIKDHAIYVEKTVYYNFGAGSRPRWKGTKPLPMGRTAS